MDKYSILRKIGQGSFGNVLLLQSKVDRKKYVLKKINLQNLSKKDITATYQEVYLLAFLHHPNIVSYKDAFKSKGGYLYIIMVYCDGGDMYSKIKKQKGIYFTEKQIIQWIIQMSLALQYLHDRNILHRDLKTQNIFLNKNNNIKIGDFGIAKVLANEDSMASTVIGTPYYMSPELFSKKSYNHKSDVWSLGCCVYEITSLRHAFHANDITSLSHKILRGKLPKIPSHYCFELQEFICNLLHTQPTKRPSASKILHNTFIAKYTKTYLKLNKTNGLLSISGSKILSNSTQLKNIDKMLSKNDMCKSEGQGLTYKANAENKLQCVIDGGLKNTRISSLVISGKEIKLGNREYEYVATKINSKNKPTRIGIAKSHQTHLSKSESSKTFTKLVHRNRDYFLSKIKKSTTFSIPIVKKFKK